MRKHRWCKIAALALAVCAVLAAFIYSRGSVPPYVLHDTLGYARVELPPEQNAFPLWLKAIEEIENPKPSRELRDAIREAATFKTNIYFETISGTLTEWLDSKRVAYDLVGKALEMPLQYPRLEPTTAFEISSNIIRWYELTKMKRVAGRLYCQQDNFEAAAQEYLDIIQQGRCMVAGEGGGIAYLLGDQTQNLGMSSLKTFCSDRRVPVSVMRELLARVPAALPEDQELARTYAIEHAFLMAHVIDMQNAKSLSLTDRLQSFAARHAIDTRATEALSRELFAQYQTNALSCPTWAACNRELLKKYDISLAGKVPAFTIGNRLIAAGHLMLTSFKQPNFIGMWHITAGVSAADSALKQSFKRRTMHNMTRAFIALQIFRRETGHYPASLGEVVEKGILDEIPVDLFDGQPVRYSAERRLLWSVSENGVDDDGDKKKDRVFALPE